MGLAARNCSFEAFAGADVGGLHLTTEDTEADLMENRIPNRFNIEICRVTPWVARCYDCALVRYRGEMT